MKTIEIHKNSITHLKTDAVVNAANSSLLEGGGVCGAIFKAAGSDKLAKECAKYKHCHTGSAVITSACDMKNNKYIIHAVGPRYFGGNQNEEKLLYSCYKKSLELAVENGCESIGFPLISAGIFGYPQKEAWEVALRACQDFLNELDDRDFNIVFVSTDRDSVELGKSILSQKDTEEIIDCRILTKYGMLDDYTFRDMNIVSLLSRDVSIFLSGNERLNLVQSIVQKKIIEPGNYESIRCFDIENADIKTTLALIVYGVRADGMDDVLFRSLMEEGLIKKWINHLFEIT